METVGKEAGRRLKKVTEIKLSSWRSKSSYLPYERLKAKTLSNNQVFSTCDDRGPTTLIEFSNVGRRPTIKFNLMISRIFNSRNMRLRLHWRWKRKNWSKGNCRSANRLAEQVLSPQLWTRMWILIVRYLWKCLRHSNLRAFRAILWTWRFH